MPSVLETLGWGPFFAAQLSAEEQRSVVPGRAVADRGPRLLVRFEDRERLVVVPGRLRAAGQVPVVGDFVLAAPGDEPVLTRVLARRAQLSRNVPGRETAEQVLAANVDLVLVVQGLDTVVNARRLERTLAAVYAGGAEPAVVLTKPDLSEDPAAERDEAAAVAPSVPVLVASGITGEGVDDVRALLARGGTAVLVGPSGSGKSTLVNALLGADVQATADVREADRRGRHTTTGRRLFAVPTGGAVIDGPGIRELRLWDAGGVGDAFDDVAALSEGCRFRDCTHDGEPGCAVVAAVEDGRLAPDRLESLHKLRRETAVQEARQGDAAARGENGRSKAVQRALRRFHGERDGE
jgi:ribosome biogenesis GTPase / thiamine phosphate phosphatase